MTNENYAAAKALKDGIALATSMLVTGSETTDIWPASIPATLTLTELKNLIAPIITIEGANTLPEDLITAISTANTDYATALKAAITAYKGDAETAFSALGS